ncbi:tRNA dihydrouridine synthase [Kosmotoga pacifica]|uniref:tRNA-dihydrouridine synthase n=1 Tax=Kosmotoga pacifica TaxID=1330330 RepID=A0A0G2Z574_9BACT|nr:tRNA-dihydrouridine synthase [Kosmotoga pacifica]AKI96707.1 dihydrouridine synthase [Kosmotoga pacifica]
MRKNFEIGLAPMAGYTDSIMRRLSLSWGADFVFTEMLSIDGILRSDKATRKLIPKIPCRVQLFGSEPDKFVQAYNRIAHVTTWIDINAGCPVKKVTKRGAGGALLNDLDRLVEIIRLLKMHTNKPVSVKIRLGWSNNRIMEIVSALVHIKPDAIFIHGRTVEQKYSGKADWDSISRAADLCHESGIPVYGSGDLFMPEAVKRVYEEYPVDGVIIARGAIGNPWIFRQSKDFIESGKYHEPGVKERLEAFVRHLLLLIEEKGEEKGIKESRKFFVGYTRGIPDAAKMRNSYMRLNTLEEIRNFMLFQGIDIESIRDVS